MRRREFIGLLGSATVWPVAAGAQQPAMPVIGFLNAGAPAVLRQSHASFLDGLKEADYIEGQNVAIDHRFAEACRRWQPILFAVK